MNEPVDILLVDDDPRNLVALDAALAMPSHRLLHATNADEALRYLLDHDIAVIVLDVVMPGTDGYALAKIIRNAKRFRQTPILFMTAHLRDELAVLEGYSAGAVDYLSKPVDSRILRQKIAIFVELFRNRRAIDALNRDLELRVRERTAELAKSEERLRQVDKERAGFIALLAHEVRNPLAPIRTGLDLLRDVERPAADAEIIETMARQIGYIVRLVDDLLDASRATRGQLELKATSVALSKVVANALATLRPVVERRRQSLVVEGTVTGQWFVDETRVVQILTNLIDNASKFSPVGGEIRVVLGTDASGAGISVTDRGPGIPATEVDRVFDMFTTIDRSSDSASGGLGIGLALSRRLAEMHGGSLTAESGGTDVGATFTFRLPLAASRPATASTEEPKPTSGVRGIVPHAKSLNVVVIEDNDDAANMLAKWLAASGYEVHVAHLGEEGLELVRRFEPDVVLCDLGLPGMDGNEVCRIVKNELVPPPTMIALTGWGSEHDRTVTRGAGFHHHLMKPVQPKQAPDALCVLSRVATRPHRNLERSEDDD